jgi:hypothetical protein
MVAADFLHDPQVRRWLDGVEPAWTLLTFDSLRALRQEPSAVQTAIRIANDLSGDEITGSAVARNTLILLRKATERGGLPVTATGNLSRAVVAEMRKLFEWPDYDQAAVLQFNKVINEADFLPLHVVRTLAQAATLVRAQGGKMVATPLGKSTTSVEWQRSLLAILFHIMFWRMDLGYFGRDLLGSWPQADIGILLWSLSSRGHNPQPFGSQRFGKPICQELLLDHLTGSGQQRFRDSDVESLGRKACRLFAAQGAVGVSCSLCPHWGGFRPIGHHDAFQTSYRKRRGELLKRQGKRGANS